MRQAILVVVALAASGCVSGHQSQPIPAPRAMAHADSVFSNPDSVQAIIRRLAQASALDSIAKKLKASQPKPPTQEPRTVFTDSALHLARCELPRAGEDWRRVCVPKDQAVVIR